MTVLEFVKSNTQRPLNPPESIFEAQDEHGQKRLLCIATFRFSAGLESLAKEFPKFLEWEITKEHFTQYELDVRKSENGSLR